MYETRYHIIADFPRTICHVFGPFYEKFEGLMWIILSKLGYFLLFLRDFVIRCTALNWTVFFFTFHSEPQKISKKGKKHDKFPSLGNAPICDILFHTPEGTTVLIVHDRPAWPNSCYTSFLPSRSPLVQTPVPPPPHIILNLLLPSLFHLLF